MKQNNSSRDEILNRIKTVREGRSYFRYNETPESEDIYKPTFPDAITCFKNELESINGACVLCKDEEDLYFKLKHFIKDCSLSSVFCMDNNLIQRYLKKYEVPYTNSDNKFEKMDAGITGCEFLIARTGSVVVSSVSLSGRQMHIFPPIHIIVANKSQLVDYVQDALIGMQEKYKNLLPSAITIITGPSRTADIEKTLVLGAHGPKEIIVFLLLN